MLVSRFSVRSSIKIDAAVCCCSYGLDHRLHLGTSTNTRWFSQRALPWSDACEVEGCRGRMIRGNHECLALTKAAWRSLKCECRNLSVGPIQAEGKWRETRAVSAREYTSRRRGVRAPGLEPGFRRWQRPVITTTLRSLVIPPTEQGFKRLSADDVEAFLAVIIPCQSGHRRGHPDRRYAS